MFTIEYLVRLVSSPCKKHFLLSILNTIDLLAIAPYFFILAMNNSTVVTTPLSVLCVVRLVRVFRILKLSRHSMSLKILGNTLLNSIRELFMLFFFLLLGVLLFSSALYYAEHDSADPSFESIPDAFWFTIVSMTTIGYGDVVPKTETGKPKTGN